MTIAYDIFVLPSTGAFVTELMGDSKKTLKEGQIYYASTDITYIRTWQGWPYLAVVADLYSRKVNGRTMKSTLARELAVHALLMAVWRRKPISPVIIHSDQGSRYDSDDWVRFYRANNPAPSMSRRGKCEPGWFALESSDTFLSESCCFV